MVKFDEPFDEIWTRSMCVKIPPCETDFLYRGMPQPKIQSPLAMTGHPCTKDGLIS